VVQLRPHLN